MFSKNNLSSQKFQDFTGFMHPFVSVIMPVRNEGKYISRSLQAVLHQNYPKDCMEILVIDGASDDETRAIIANFQVDYSNIILIDNPHKIVPYGLNLGILQAKGEIIVRVDGHCEIAPNYVRNCVTHLMDENISVVGGPMQTIGETLSAKAIAVVMSSPFGVGGSAFRTVKNRSMFVETVPFPAYRKTTLLQTGPFDEELVRNQDDEYNYRIGKQGGKILLSPDISSVYYSRSSLRSLWHQYYQYGYWKVRVMQKHPVQMRIRQFVPPLFILALFFSGILFLFFPKLIFLSIIVPSLYLFFVIGASIYLTIKNNPRYFPWIFCTIPILHLSYGFGFWVGIWKFRNRWGKVPKNNEG